MPKMNWSKESDGSTVYPAATYQVRVVTIERGESREKKTPQLAWKAEIVQPDEHRGRTIMDYTALTQAALWRISKAVQACGIVTPEGSMDTDSPQFDAIVNACRERTVYWNVTEDMYNGTVRNKVVDYKQDPEQEVIEPPVEDKIEWNEEEKIKA